MPEKNQQATRTHIFFTFALVSPLLAVFAAATLSPLFVNPGLLSPLLSGMMSSVPTVFSFSAFVFAVVVGCASAASSVVINAQQWPPPIYANWPQNK